MRWLTVLEALWLFLPAYVANMSPVFSAKILPKWTRPIDGGRTHADGRRLLGDGKTWRGLAGGGVFAALTAVAMALLAAPAKPGWMPGMDLSHGQGTPLIAIAAFGAVVGVMALVGDTVESYFKRRRGRDRGTPWIPFDQLDFVVGGILGFLIGIPLLAPGWVIDALFGHWLTMATLLILTPALHLLVNRIGYWLRLKEVPW